jgi:hypothetical protein
MTTLGFMIAAPAASATVIHPNAVPADCKFNTPNGSATLTCTARPAGQIWALTASCWLKDGLTGPIFVVKSGNEVTGNGTSTIAICFEAGGPVFNVLS